MASKKTASRRSRTATSGKRASGGGRKTSGRPKADRTARGGAPAPGLALRSTSPSFTVNDLEKSLAFYRDVLGMAVSDRWEHEGRLMGVEMEAGATTFMLAQDDWKKGRDRVKGEGFRLYCETSENIDALAGRIRGKGGRLTQEPRDESWGARTFSLEDPDGFKITIAKPKARGR